VRAPLALSFAFAVLVIGTAGRTARAAGDEATADAAIRRGVELRKLGKDQDALEEFRKAYAAAKTPRALAQIGLAEQALGRWVDAEADLDSAVASKSDPWIRKNATTLNGALEVIRRHLGSLDVIGPEGAELRVDGRAAGVLPLSRPARVPIGNLTIEVRKAGFFAVTRPISITPGELTRETVDLQPVAVAAPPVSSTPRPREGLPQPMQAGGSGGGDETLPNGTRPGPDSGGGTAADPGASADRSWHRTLGWTAAVGALLGAAGGVGALVYRSGKITNANDLACHVDDSKGTVNPEDPANAGRCSDLASAASGAKLGAIISFSAAGALAVTAVVLFATAPSSSGRSAAAAHSTATAGLTCGPTIAVTGMACNLRF